MRLFRNPTKTQHPRLAVVTQNVPVQLQVAGLFTRWLVRGVKRVVQNVGAQVSRKKTLFASVYDLYSAVLWNTLNSAHNGVSQSNNGVTLANF